VSFRDVLRVLRRWRWVVVPVLLVAIGAAGAVYTVTPREYGQTESYLLLYPVQSAEGAGNPLLQLGNGVGLAASVLATKVSAPDTAARLTSGTPGLTYTVAPDATTTAPILVVTADGGSRAAVAGALDRVGEELVDQLSQLQASTGAPKASWVTISRLTRDPSAAPSHKAGVRDAVAALAGIALVGLLVVTGLESGARRRRSRAAAPQRTVPLAPPAAPVREASVGETPVRHVAADGHAAREPVVVSSGER
jgi:hypothetical protein